ncbi:hypothetical protein JZ751_028286 [Albula glossodonta]|uniref:Integrin alpha-2 domain-containing protein n=1 Tax=Albula glossodonta TaxID=121402 RepID=A0A8T2MVI4_9TELE|nr:hypothetical protein JZ751_028286 [Albula glossodonta]
MEAGVPDKSSGGLQGVSVLIGAPKANTSQSNVIEGGSVYYCPWGLSQSDCSTIGFDRKGDRSFHVNNTDLQVEFKSHQWFGATVRSHGNTILACAPRYYWRTEKDEPHSDATGTCYLSVDNFTKFVEYAPCRTERSEHSGQGYCQGGFSADFTKNGKVVLGGPGSYFWQGQLISASKEEIVKAYFPEYFLLYVPGQMQTKQAQGEYDDSYLGYSVAVGEFSGDTEEDFVAGVPKGVMLYGLVSLLDGTNMKSMLNITGEQMGSYFGYAVATTDVNNDGLIDLLVGAPMFMVRGSGGRLEEMGRVYLYLQRGPLDLELSLPPLTGTLEFGRFGSSIAPLGDLNQDGFNDVAISCPFGGEDQQGVVLIYNGQAGGLKDTPSQVLTGQWASTSLPASFGYAVRGNKDLDDNGYPDLIVGAFGVDKAVLFSASLTVYPTMINPEEKSCVITNGNDVNLSFCLSANGKHLPDDLGFAVEVQLDRLKQKGAVKRALFVDSQQAVLQKTFRVGNGARICHDTKIYLRFRDKLSSIYIALNFSLDPAAAANSHALRPILNYQTVELIEQKAQILLDCGEDNICVPDLKLTGEGGAYEAELYVVLPPEADYSGIARNNESLSQLTCSYETENQTRYLSCDLGNPMKSGTNLWAGLRFTIPRLRDTRRTVQFELQIRSKNENNSQSEVVPYKLEEEQDIGPPVQHVYELVNNGPSKISHTLLELHCPMKVKSHRLMYPLEVTTVGPLNCSTNRTVNPLGLKLQQPPTDQPPLHTAGPEHHIERRDAHKDQLSEPGNLSCSNVECWVLQCHVGLLEKGTSAILKVRSRIWAETFIERVYKQYVLECSARYSVQKMPYAILPKEAPSGSKKVVTPVVWSKPDSQYAVPLWASSNAPYHMARPRRRPNSSPRLRLRPKHGNQTTKVTPNVFLFLFPLPDWDKNPEYSISRTSKRKRSLFKWLYWCYGHIHCFRETMTEMLQVRRRGGGERLVPCSGAPRKRSPPRNEPKKRGYPGSPEGLIGCLRQRSQSLIRQASKDVLRRAGFKVLREECSTERVPLTASRTSADKAHSHQSTRCQIRPL